MNCHEFREIMSRSVGAELDSKTRQQVAFHLADCPECLQLISEDKFWDDSLIALLDREAPEDLRAEILGDLADESGLSRLGWKKNLKLMAWGARRNTGSSWYWLKVAGVTAAVVWLVPLAMQWQSSTEKDAFKSPGPVVIIRDGQLLSPDTPLVTGSLSFEGRLF
jgi:Putative zinc-finger